MPASAAKAESPAATRAESSTAAPRSGLRRILLIAGGIVALAVAAGAGWFFAPRQAADAVGAPQPGHAQQNAKSAPAKKTPSLFLPLELFTVNIADREHYLQIGLTYEVTGGELVDSIKQKMPILRSRILLLLSNKTIEQLSSAEGKEALAAELVEQALKAAGAEQGVEAVHFSAFVIQ